MSVQVETSIAGARTSAGAPSFEYFLDNLDNSPFPITAVYAMALVDELYLNKGTHEPSLNNKASSFDEFLSTAEVKAKGMLPLKVKMNPEGALEFLAKGSEETVWVLEPVL